MEQKEKSIFTSPTGSSYLFPFILVTSLFLMWGLAHGLSDVLNKHFQTAFTMSIVQSGLVRFSTYIAYALFSIPAGIFMKKYGYEKGIILGLLLYAVGAFGFIPAAYLHSANPFLITLFVVVCGLCVLATAVNPYSAVLSSKENAAQRINLSQSFNGLGWVLRPFIGGQLFISFFFMSIMFPTIFALGVARMGVCTKKASSFLIYGSVRRDVRSDVDRLYRRAVNGYRLHSSFGLFSLHYVLQTKRLSHVMFC
jgi:fucose permease